MDPQPLSGFVGALINILLEETLKALKVAIYCRRELHTLELQLRRIIPLVDSARSDCKFISRTQRDGGEQNAVRRWLQSMHSLLREANNMVNECTIPPYNLLKRYRMARRIEAMNKQIQDLLSDAGIVNLTQQLFTHKKIMEKMESMCRSIVRRPSIVLSGVEPVSEPDIIGQESLFQELQDQILSVPHGDEDCCIGITGMGGAGKTLLLRTVINSEPVQRAFANDLIVWLTVSQTPLESLLPKLGRAIANQTMSAVFDDDWTAEELKGFVRRTLRQRRFLITLDDVWGGNESLIGFLLLLKKRDSKIVLTSRDQGLLSRMGIRRTIAMRFLAEEEGWQLFKIHAFLDDLPPQLESVARDVARECKGLPLAIRVVGAAMAAQSYPLEQWQNALEKLRNADVVSPEQEVRLFGKLRLSLDVLSGNLKLCFLYFAAYKEDAVISAEDIIFLWNYEGLLGTSRGYGFMQRGRELLNSLVERCLIDVVIKDRNGQVTCCKIHDVVRDLALRVAWQEEGCFFRAGRDLTEVPPETCSDNFQIISLKDNKLSTIREDFKGLGVRTLLLSGNRRLNRLPENVMSRLIDLRILDLRQTAIQFLPESLGSLKQLICLRLSGTPIERLPARSLGRLKKLQVLDLSECSMLTELPESLSKLKSLQILDLHACQSLEYLPLGITALVSLQVLKMDECFASAWPVQFMPPKTFASRIARCRSIRNPNLTDLKSLTELRCLEIDNWRDMSIPTGMMTCFPHLEKLMMGMHSIQTLPDDMGKIRGLRQLVLKCGSLKELTATTTAAFKALQELKLFHCRSLESLPAFDSLPLLTRLEIHECHGLSRLPTTFGRSGAFPSLKVLWLRKLNNLQELPSLHARAMPHLQVLGIEKCMQITRLPQGTKRLVNLKVLSIYGSRELMRVTSEGGEDWETVRKLQREKNVKVLTERNSEWMNEFGGKSGED